MPIWALTRRSWAVWAMPVTALITITLRSDQLALYEKYPPWAAAQKAYAVVIIGMISAVTGAAEGGWLRASNLVELPAARRPGIRFMAHIMLSWLPTAALVLLGIASVGGLPAWEIWGPTLASLLAWTTLGFALGVTLRRAVALPLSVVFAFTWFAFTPSMHPEWIRHLAGTWDGCCDISTDPSNHVAAGIVIFAGSLALASWLVVLAGSQGLRPRIVWLGIALGIVLAGFAGAGMVVRSVGYFPVQARTDDVVCHGHRPEVCIWPERQAYAAAMVLEVQELAAHWTELGVSMPETLGEDAVHTPRDGVSPLIYSRSADPAQRTEWLA